MNRLISDQRGASHVVAVLVIVLVAVVGFAGYRVMSADNQSNQALETSRQEPAAVQPAKTTKVDVQQANASLDKEVSSVDTDLDAAQLDADLNDLL